MIYVHKDGTGYTVHPVPEDPAPYLEVTGVIEQRVVAGEPYRLINGGEDLEFLPQAEVDALAAEQALEAERSTMVVSRFQARAALHNANLLVLAESAISGAGDLAQMAWQDAQEFRRNSPTVAAIADSLGLTETQLDDLFRQAATIEA